MDLSAIGARIKEARLKKKLTQEQLAELADVGFYYIGEIERGQKLPSLTVFIQIVEALGVSVPVRFVLLSFSLCFLVKAAKV